MVRPMSGLQKEVVSLYRALWRVTRTQPQLRAHVQNDFREHLDISRTDVERIEYLLRKGRKQLDMLSMKGVKKVTFVTGGQH